MVLRSRKVLAALALMPMLVAAAPELPPNLAPYVTNGHLEPGDYRWLRGLFHGASMSQMAAYREMIEWRRRCRREDMARTRDELLKLHVSAGSSLEGIPYRTLICDQAATLPEPIDVTNWQAFEHDVGVVRPIAATFMAAVKMAEDATPTAATDLRDVLLARTVAEQTLRSGLAWASDPEVSGGPSANLTPPQRGILVSYLAIELADRDHANTTWLKTIVGRHGWPKRSKVGAAAAKSAWLLVQHADADPAFQVSALRLMEMLLPSGEVDQRDFAFLYDRVMLKISGRQRYGSQLVCNNGALVNQALEDEKKVDAWRRKVGMEKLADYKLYVLREMGPCSPEAIK